MIGAPWGGLYIEASHGCPLYLLMCPPHVSWKIHFVSPELSTIVSPVWLLKCSFMCPLKFPSCVSWNAACVSLEVSPNRMFLLKFPAPASSVTREVSSICLLKCLPCVCPEVSSMCLLKYTFMCLLKCPPCVMWTVARPPPCSYWNVLRVLQGSRSLC